MLSKKPGRSTGKIWKGYPRKPAHPRQGKRFGFDLEHNFLRRIPEDIKDLNDIQQTFPFNRMVCDVLFAASRSSNPFLGYPWTRPAEFSAAGEPGGAYQTMYPYF
jgi:hypothetical protein